MPADETPARWQRRATWATAIRVAVFCAPILASVGAAWAVREALPPAAGLGAKAVHLAVLVVVSTAVLLLVDRVGRKALPLVTLLDLNMLFPDRAPSRVKVAREAIKKRPIEEQLARVRKAGADPGAVAREILTLVAALSQHDRPTRGHAERVRMFTDLLAAQMKVPARDRDLLRWAAILHDIGKLKVPATLLNKPGKPTDEEWELLKAHPSHGAEMAEALLPWLGDWGDCIVQHHERYDGTGYPSGLSGAQISLGARIVSVADAYDVMTAARAYKRPVSRAAALEELVKWSGRQFDPEVVRAMVAVGAPRLRKAQGVVAWLADVPLVATGSVPAATVARVVGAGALATGAVTGGVALADGFQMPRAQAATTAAAATAQGEKDAAGTAAPTPSQSSSGGRASDPQAPGTGADPEAPSTGAAAAPDEPSGPADDPTTGAPSDGGGAKPPRTGSGPSTEPGTPSDPTDPTDPKDPVKDPVDAVEKVVKDPVGTVEDIVKDPVGTVDRTVDGAVGTVTGTVGGAVSDPVGTVGGTVSDPVGTVGGALGGSSSPSPSPSPTSSSGGGLLGGMLGK